MVASADNNGDAAAAAKRRALAGVQAVFDRYHKLAATAPRRDGQVDLFDHDCMSRVELLDAGPEGSVVFRFTVDQRYANLNNVVHGGAYGVLFDMFTTTALGPLARPGSWDFMGGVTRALNIAYLRAVPVGTTVYFRSRVVGVGRTMALIKGEMTSADGRIVYATAEHHKVNVPMLAEHAAARIPWDDAMEEEEREKQKAGRAQKL